MNTLNDEFTSVDIEEFYDSKELNRNDEFSTSLVVLTEHEQTLVNTLFDRLKVISPESLEVFANRVADLERLTKNIAHFPSLYQHQTIDIDGKSENSIIESLLQNRGGDRMLHLPSKAILGKGYIVAKFKVFMSMTKIARECNFPPEEIAEYQKATLNLMFTIMSEDVYFSLLENLSLPEDLRETIASSLIVLWEHRTDANILQMAPVLESVWHARKRLAPVFGTMVGTSELLLFSIQMDEQWRKFIATQLGEPEICMALEEFLFGLTYEDITRLKQILHDKGISAVGREEVATLLNKPYIQIPLATTEDPREFFLDYSIRRDNAKARQRMNLSGPHHTLEDYYMCFLMQKNKEKQYNDVYAK